MSKKINSISSNVYERLKLLEPKIDKVGGRYEIVNSDDCVLSDIKYVLTTGIRVFDDIVGAFPFGRISEVYGLEQSGKTALMIRTAIRARLGHIYEIASRDGAIYELKRLKPSSYTVTIVYVDNEQSLEDGYKIEITELRYNEDGSVKKEKHRLENVCVCRCDTVEYLFKIADETISTIKKMEAEERKEHGDNEKLNFVLMVVDTIAGTSSKEEQTKEWGKDDYPRQARQLHEGFRIMKNDLSRHNVAMICTNQATESMATDSFGRKYLPPDHGLRAFGGKALKFYATHRIFMKAMETKYTLVKGARFPAGVLLEFYSSKNRIRKPKRIGKMVLLYDDKNGGLNDEFSLLETFIYLDFAEIDEDDGGIRFRFNHHGVPTTTFSALKKSLEEQDEEPTRRIKRDPKIDCRADWPLFYRAHRADFDALYRAALEYVFTTEGLEIEEDEDSGAVISNDTIETPSEMPPSEEAHVTHGDGGVGAPSDSPAKRGRGRPRKVAASPLLMQPVTESTQMPVEA